MLKFEHTEYIWALLAIPLIAVLFIMMRAWRKNALQRFGDLPLMRQLASEVSEVKPVIKFVLVSLAAVFLVLTMMNPQLGTKVEEAKREGSDIIIAIDVSNSMKAEDLKPNRLEKAKQSIERMLEQLTGDRIGLIVFAGEAYVQLPITSDYNAAKMFMETIDTDIVPVQGTSVASAIRLATESFGEPTGKRSRSVIIISDGESHDQDAEDAASEASDKGVTIHTIGMGSPNGVPIPVYRDNIQIGFHKDRNGNTVVTKLNESFLKEIASEGNGIYVRATNAETGLNTVLTEINKLEKEKFETKIFTGYEDRYQYVIAVALLLLVIDSVISERRSTWLRKVDLFGEKKQTGK